MPSNHLTLCRPLFPPSVFPSIRVFSNESALCIRWPKYWSFSISPSNEYSGLIFPLGWTGWISLQSRGLSRVFSNTTVQKHQFWRPAFFMAQLSRPCLTAVETAERCVCFQCCSPSGLGVEAISVQSLPDLSSLPGLLWSPNMTVLFCFCFCPGLPCDSASKESACNAGDLGLIPGLERSSGEGKGYPLQCSGLENSIDCIGQGVAKSWTGLSDFHFHFTCLFGAHIDSF